MTSRCALTCILTLGTMSVFLGQTASARADDKSVSAIALGEKLSKKSSLRDLRGNRRPLQDFKDHRALVLAFLGADCPISKLYVSSLLELEKKYRDKDVQFIAIYPNEHEDLDRVAVHSYECDIPSPVLKDFQQQLAGALGIERVPAVAVLDKDFVLRYRGRIDDRYGVAFRRDKATRQDLLEAIQDVLDGKKVRVAETEADGCLLDRGGSTAPRKDVTYTKHVAPI